MKYLRSTGDVVLHDHNRREGGDVALCMFFLSLEPKSSKVRSGLRSSALKRWRCYPTPLLNREVLLTQRLNANTEHHRRYGKRVSS